jgi:hypothetical protein
MITAQGFLRMIPECLDKTTLLKWNYWLLLYCPKSLQTCRLKTLPISTPSSGGGCDISNVEIFSGQMSNIAINGPITYRPSNHSRILLGMKQRRLFCINYSSRGNEEQQKRAKNVMKGLMPKHDNEEDTFGDTISDGGCGIIFWLHGARICVSIMTAGRRRTIGLLEVICIFLVLVHEVALVGTAGHKVVVIIIASKIALATDLGGLLAL